MITLLLLSLLAAPVVAQSATPAPAAPAAPSLPSKDDAEIDGQIAAAGSDVAKLLALAGSCEAGSNADGARKVYAKVLALDPANEAAHKALRHQFYDKQWFESMVELSKYKREEDAKMKLKGLVRYKDGWVPEADMAFLNMGWSQDKSGAWTSPLDAAHQGQVEQWQKDGYQFRSDDNSWIAPDEAEMWAKVLWKCGDEWVEMAVANEYHSKLGRWWELAGEHFVVWTTCEWDDGNAARWYADQAYPDLVRLFGVEPARPPHFIVLNSLAQYNQVSGGNPPSIPDSEGWSSVFGAYFADGYFDASVTPRQFIGCGVSFWDRSDPKLKVWGPYFLRWAAAQSFVDAIDPSWKTIGDLVAGAQGGDAAAAGGAFPFWSEKKIPRWLRYGAASYAERFLKNPEAGKDSDPWDIRKFACGELEQAGGLRKLDDIFVFKIDPASADDATRLYHEAGLLVAFLLDGAEGNKPLATAHEAFKEALKSGNQAEVAAAADHLQKQLVKSEPEIRKFAGL